MSDKFNFFFGCMVKVRNGIHSIGSLNKCLEISWWKGGHDLLILIFFNGNWTDSNAGEFSLFSCSEYSWWSFNYAWAKEIINNLNSNYFDLISQIIFPLLSFFLLFFPDSPELFQHSIMFWSDLTEFLPHPLNFLFNNIDLHLFHFHLLLKFFVFGLFLHFLFFFSFLEFL